MSAGGKIMFILFLIIIVGVGLYIYNSGAISSLATKAGSLLKFSTSSSAFSSTTFTAPIGPTLQPAPPSGGGGTSGSASNPSNPNLVASNIPAGFTASQLSPDFEEVRIGGVLPGSPYSYGQITLNANLQSGQEIDITGWEIKSRNGGEYVPRAVNLYDPSGLTPASDIVVKQGDQVEMFSTSAPINLRLNECMGYIAHMANFVPALPVSCPAVDYSSIQNFTGACQNYIESIPSCQSPNMSDPRIPQNDYACRDYLENNFTYKSCFQQHVNDPNFLSNQVWVWMGGNVADQFHDQIELLDKNGLLVDVYSY